MTQWMKRSVLVSALLGACGGSNKGASEPEGGAKCDAVGTHIAETALAGADDAEREANAAAAGGVTKACVDGAWTPTQMDCFLGATTPDAMQACSASLSEEQQGTFMEAMAPIFMRPDPAATTEPLPEATSVDSDDGGE